jgi:hypothetical protein
MDEQQGTGWLVFAAVVLVFAGVMRIFDAVWAFRFNGSLPDHLSDSVFGDSLTTYGWIFLIVGAILILSGIGVLYRSQFSRWIGVIAAAIGGLSAVAWLPYYPFWSMVYILLAVLIMYGLIAYGGRIVLPGESAAP